MVLVCRFKVPGVVVPHRGALPLNSTGKVKKNEVRVLIQQAMERGEEASEKELAAPNPTPTLTRSKL